MLRTRSQKAKKEKDEKEANDQEMPAFSQQVRVDDTIVFVSAGEGTFEKDAKLEVTKIEEPQALQMAESAVDQQRDQKKTVATSYTFDVHIVNKEGKELQPAEGKKATVTFARAEVASSNLDTQVYHLSEGTGDVLEAEPLPTMQMGPLAMAVTDGFSYYTVEFTYNNLQYVMKGGTSIPLSEIMSQVGLTGMVSNATSSNPELFSVEKDAEGVWQVTALQAFHTEEWLKVTIDNVEYEIAVTDASFKFDTSITALYESGCLKSLELTIVPIGNYAEAYGKLAVHSAESKYGWTNRYLQSGATWDDVNTEFLMSNDNLIAWQHSADEFLWSSWNSSNPGVVEIDFGDGIIDPNQEATNYVHLWTRAPAYGIYPDALITKLYTGNGTFKDDHGEIKKETTHTHEWSLTANGNTATVKCTAADCSYTTGKEYTATIRASDATYDGNTHGGRVSTLEGFPTEVTVSGITYTGTVADGTNYNSTTAPTNAGTYAASATVTVGSTTQTITQSFTIAKAPLTVTANDEQIVYGHMPEGKGVTYDGFVGDDTEADQISGTLSYSYNYEQFGDAGTYTGAIVPKGLSSNNYALTYVPGNLEVTQLPITFTWTGDEFVYNGSEQGPTVLASTVNNDEVGVTAQDNSAVHVGSYTAKVTGITGSKAGNYSMSSDEPTASHGWSIVQASNAASVAIEGWTYGESPNTPTCTATWGAETARFEYSESSDEGFSADVPTQAGTYYVRAIVDETNDYAGATSESVAFEIKKAPLTVTANDEQIVYGHMPEGKGVTYDGFVGDDTEADQISGTLSYSYNYERFGDVGTYDINPLSLTSNNYDIVFKKGVLTVVQCPIVRNMLTVDPSQFSYDGSAKSPVAKLVLTVDGESYNLVEGKDFEVSGTTEETNANTYSMVFTGKGNFKDAVEDTWRITGGSELTLAEKAFGEGKLQIKVDVWGEDLELSANPEGLTVDAAWNMLTSEEQELVNAGATCEVYIVMRQIEEPASEDEKPLADVATEQSATQGIYFDLSMWKHVDGQPATQITDTGSNSMTFEIRVPSKLENSSTKVTRSFGVARSHDGEGSIVSSPQFTTGASVAFSTNKFSGYAMLYKDVKNQDKSSSSSNSRSSSSRSTGIGSSYAGRTSTALPSTFDPLACGTMMSALVVTGSTLLVSGLRRRRR